MTNYPNDPNQMGGDGEQQPNDGSPRYGENPQYGAQPYGAPPYDSPEQDASYGAQPYGSLQYGAPQPPAEHKRTTLVLVLGILSIPTMFCYVGVVLGIIAVVLGRKTLQEIDASGSTVGGRNKVQAGYICGIIGTVLSVIVIVLAIVAVATHNTTTP